MKTIITGTLLFLLSFLAHSSVSKVVLLTSLMETAKITVEKNQKLQKKLEGYFNHSYKNSGFELIIKHEVTPMTLRKYLKDPSVKGLFWVSHARGVEDLNTGVQNSGKIIDAFGNNVSDLFRNIHPNMKWLALIGCQTKSILESIKKDGFLDKNTSLSIHSFKKKVSAKRGMKKALFESAFILGQRLQRSHRSKNKKNPVIKASPENLDFEFPVFIDRDLLYVNLNGSFTNEIFEKPVVLRVDFGNELVGFYTVTNRDFSYKIGLNLANFSGRKNRNLKVSLVAKKKNDLSHLPEQISIENGEGGHAWKLFEDRNGRPVGVNTYLLLYL